MERGPEREGGVALRAAPAAGVGGGAGPVVERAALSRAASERAVEVRRAAGLFLLSDRGLLRVEGSDRTRWLDGMLSNDVGRLAQGPEASGCYALLRGARPYPKFRYSRASTVSVITMTG